MKLGKRVRPAIESDFAPDMAVLVIAKIGMPALQQAWRSGSRFVRQLVAEQLAPVSTEQSEIDAVTAIVEQTVSESVLIPAGIPTGATYSVFLPE